MKLHHTLLDGRRLNVERSAGGNRNSANRKLKLRQYRREQDELMSSTVDKMLEEYYESNDIQRGELDDGVIAVCKRHSAAVVQAALEEYVGKGGGNMDNTSAYLNFLLGKMAHEGIDKEKQEQRDSNKDKRMKDSRERGGTSNSKSKRARPPDEEGNKKSLSSIFPSFGSRGRGKE